MKLILVVIFCCGSFVRAGENDATIRSLGAVVGRSWGSVRSLPVFVGMKCSSKQLTGLNDNDHRAVESWVYLSKQFSVIVTVQKEVRLSDPINPTLSKDSDDFKVALVEFGCRGKEDPTLGPLPFGLPDRPSPMDIVSALGKPELDTLSKPGWGELTYRMGAAPGFPFAFQFRENKLYAIIVLGGSSPEVWDSYFNK